jgi:hypothetical protein
MKQVNLIIYFFTLSLQLDVQHEMMMAILKTKLRLKKLCSASMLLTQNQLQFKKCDKHFFCMFENPCTVKLTHKKKRDRKFYCW